MVVLNRGDRRRSVELDGSARSKCHVSAFIVVYLISSLRNILFTKTKRLTTANLFPSFVLAYFLVFLQPSVRRHRPDRALQVLLCRLRRRLEVLWVCWSTRRSTSADIVAVAFNSYKTLCLPWTIMQVHLPIQNQVGPRGKRRRSRDTSRERTLLNSKMCFPSTGVKRSFRLMRAIGPKAPIKILGMNLRDHFRHPRWMEEDGWLQMKVMQRLAPAISVPL